MRKSEYYKIVSVEAAGNKKIIRKSFVQHLPSVTQYKVHRYVKAPIGGLLVFNSLLHALDNRKYDNQEIWRVLVKEPVTLPTHRAGTLVLPSWEEIEIVWGTKRPASEFHNWCDLRAMSDVSGYSWYSWPEGTEAFKYVRLEERVK